MYFLCFYFFLSLHTSLLYIIKKIEQSLKQKQNINCLTDFTKPALVKNKKTTLGEPPRGLCDIGLCYCFTSWRFSSLLNAFGELLLYFLDFVFVLFYCGNFLCSLISKHFTCCFCHFSMALVELVSP